jgi:SAM-dependent methyltransferase
MRQVHQPEFLECSGCAAVTRHDHLYVKNGCDILRCRACGLGRAAVANFDPAAYYTRDYFSARHVHGYVDYVASEPVLRRKFSRDVAFIRRHCPSGRLIEIGCAYGFFLLEARGWFDVAGIELAEDAARHCRSAGLRVITGTASEANLERLGEANAIVLFDVIEHLPDPYETLARCARHLRPGGVIVLTTGDFGSRMAQLFGAGWRLMTPPEHLWFFTAESFRHIQRLGLAVNAIDYPWRIVPASLILFQLGRMLGRRWTAPAAASRIGLPLNFFDTMRLVLRRTDGP